MEVGGMISDPAVQAGILDRLQEIFDSPSQWEVQA